MVAPNSPQQQIWQMLRLQRHYAPQKLSLLSLLRSIWANVCFAPDVTDYERTSAKLILDNLRLDLQYTFEDRFHDTVEAGHVIATDPVAGTVLSEGDSILLLISKGPEIRQVKVPSFVGMTPDVAQQSADAQGLVITITEQEDEAPAGMIIGQSVAAETTVPEGTAITLTMSMGMPETDVPVDENGNPILPPDDGGTE